jgi:hypothetical protein
MGTKRVELRLEGLLPHSHEMKLFAKGAPDVRVLETCRQIYAEAALLPLAHRTFCFYETPSCLSAWIEKLSPTQKDAIEEVEAYCWEVTKYPLRHFNGLKTVILRHATCGRDMFQCATAIEERLRKLTKRDGLTVRRPTMGRIWWTG